MRRRGAVARWVISAPGGPELAPCSKSLDITFACHGPVRHVVTSTIKYVNASGAAKVMAWGWGNLCQQLAGKSGRCVVLAKDRVAVRACGGSDEHEEAPRRGSASAVRMAPSAAQEGQMRGVYRGEKGDFFRPSGVNCSGLCAAVRGLHILSEGALKKHTLTCDTTCDAQ